MQPLPSFAVPLVYETKPATEWILGQPVQKVSRRYTHACLQGTLFTWLRAWARNRGRVGSEWRVWLTPEGEVERYLVPDVMYISYERLPREAEEAAEEPHTAPDAVFEIRSPDDRERHLAHKIDVYLRAGTSLVAIVDPRERRITLHDRTYTRILRETERFEHPALREFTFALNELFSEPHT